MSSIKLCMTTTDARISALSSVVMVQVGMLAIGASVSVEGSVGFDFASKLQLAISGTRRAPARLRP
jgi:hypothetical protein